MYQTFCVVVEVINAIVTVVFSYFSRHFVHGHSYLKVYIQNAGTEPGWGKWCGASGSMAQPRAPK